MDQLHSPARRRLLGGLATSLGVGWLQAAARSSKLAVGLSGALHGVGAAAQATWRSALYPAGWVPPATSSFETSRLIQDFSFAGYRRGETGLPSVSSPLLTVTDYGADPTGSLDSTTAIQAALDAARSAGGGVVYLPEGIYRVAPQGTNLWALRINGSHVVLRGAGRHRSFLLNDTPSMRGREVLRVEGSTSRWSSVPSGSPQPLITLDLMNPSTTLPVTSVAGFAVGDWVVVRADATDAFIAEHNMTDLWAGLGSALGGVQFLRQVTAIDATTNTLTIDVPTRYYLKVRDNARVHKAVAHLEEVGLEDFSIGNREHPGATSSTGWGENDYTVTGTGAYEAHGCYAIALRRARNCWVARVGTYRPSSNIGLSHILSNGLLLENCRGVTVQDCDFQRPLYGGGGGNGYMYRLLGSNECLLVNCAARYNRHGFVMSLMSCSGNVIHGGIAQVTRTQAAPPGTCSGEGCDHHMHLSQSNLIDGVQLDRDFFTAHYRGTYGTAPQHGQTAVHSVFWNLVGTAYQSNKAFIVRTEQARYGYVIGTRGPASGISTSGLLDLAGRTQPTDHTEGSGTGDSLLPLSLYHDQLGRRLGALQVPPHPVALSAIGGSGQVELRWYAASTASAYSIKRSTTQGGPYTVVATVSVTAHTDTRVIGGTPYYYVVSAINGAGEGGTSLEATATPLVSQTPAAPTALTATAVSSTQVNLAWSDNSGNESGFAVERSTRATSGFKQIASLPVDTRIFSNTGLKSRTSYYYRVRAYNSMGNSAYSNTATVKTP